MGYTYCEKCKIDMEFVGFDDEDDETEFPDEIYECPKCGEEAYVN